jgi:tripartite-type tricarboxylate transporter receptor subunit TctC
MSTGQKKSGGGAFRVTLMRSLPSKNGGNLIVQNMPGGGSMVAANYLYGIALGRPMVAPPGVPADRVKILREAYSRSLKDPELVAEVEKSRLDMEPSMGEEIEAVIREVMGQSPAVVERVKKVFSG